MFVKKLFHLLAVAVIMASILTLSKNIGRDTLNICIKNVLKVAQILLMGDRHEICIRNYQAI